MNELLGICIYFANRAASIFHLLIGRWRKAATLRLAGGPGTEHCNQEVKAKRSHHVCVHVMISWFLILVMV